MTWGRIAVLVSAMFVVGCSGTSRVGDDLTAATLTQRKKGVVLMIVSAADPRCHALSVGFGVREKGGFRDAGGVTITRSKEQPPVGEVELEPGEYHLIGYACARSRRDGSPRYLALDRPHDGNVYTKSYASFTVQPGEVVNVGFLRVDYLGETRGAFGDTLRANLTVGDWPLAELERFRQQRPNLYAQMKTRLMILARPEPAASPADGRTRPPSIARQAPKA